MYSFGFILNEVVSNTSSFSAIKMNCMMIINCIVNDHLCPSISDSISKKLKRHIERCLDHNPKNRPTSFGEIYSFLKDKKCF